MSDPVDLNDLRVQTKAARVSWVGTNPHKVLALLDAYRITREALGDLQSARFPGRIRESAIARADALVTPEGNRWLNTPEGDTDD